jgi:hypothetical protein
VFLILALPSFAQDYSIVCDAYQFAHQKEVYTTQTVFLMFESTGKVGIVDNSTNFGLTFIVNSKGPDGIYLMRLESVYNPDGIEASLYTPGTYGAMLIQEHYIIFSAYNQDANKEITIKFRRKT